MKIAPANAERFCRQPHPELAAVLLFGTDSGLVQERAQLLARARLGRDSASDALERLDREALTHGGLTDHARQMSLIAGQRVIQVADAGDWLTADVQALTEGHSQQDALVLLLARELKPGSTLRKLCESHAQLAALNCFSDDERALRQVIADWARGQSRPLDREAQALLESQLGANRAMTRNELEKLALFLVSAPAGQAIRREDVLACFSDVKKVDLSDPVIAAFDGKPARALSACQQLAADGKSPDALLAVYLGHLSRLCELQLAVARGQPLAEAVAGLRPPVFFALKPTLMTQAQRWSSEAILQRLLLLAAATQERLRQPQVGAWQELERLLLATCRAAD